MTAHASVPWCLWRGVVVMGGGQSVRLSVSRVVVVGGRNTKKGLIVKE